MPVRSILRVNAGVWLAIPMGLIAALFSMAYTPATTDPYAVALTAAGTITTAFIAPICAAIGAWEGARFRRAAWWELPHVRPRATIAAWATAPIIVAGSAAVTVASVLQLVGAGLVIPDLRVMALTVVVVCAHTLVGFAAGLWVPVVIAAPAALVVSFLWMAFPAAMQPLWLRHLNGSPASCCIVGQDLAPEALAAGLLVAAGMIVGSMVLIGQARLSAIRTVVAVVPIAVALGAAAVLVSPLGPDPAVARSGSALACATDPSGIEVCVWPEHARRLESIVQIAADAVGAWEAEGIPTGRRFSELPTQSDPGFGFSLRSTEPDIVDSLAYGLLPAWPPCAETEAYLAAPVLDDLRAWFSAVAGMSEADLAQRFAGSSTAADQAPLVAVRALRSRPAEIRRDWVAMNLEAASGCHRAPMDVPLA